ncbi:MAG: hypothetical protein SOU37_05600 [Campylobacter lanienae]|uniref:hypothetical protein n=1 Tax=Campylobacter sp. TaxID=205 RepID=UPI002A763816|nr:hypothetical protein [Campylobacter sp.]MDD7323575.1 hypothetical protein [Campylobacteraceae bacterium]MDY2818078.1 hypothetical protein [Campylobacter lanienae]MCI6344194.1 hypothetical protein [Campylobacter sp.]MCI6694601.1 hypothetical protein [Campylobacter sp.]MCI7464546.1 hypothetical protein [Campylobacter sp.]
MRAIIASFALFVYAFGGEADFWQNDCVNDCVKSHLPQNPKPRLKAKDKAMFNGIYNNYESKDRVEGKM